MSLLDRLLRRDPDALPRTVLPAGYRAAGPAGGLAAWQAAGGSVTR